ncbi:Amidase [Patulibacter medicamentivorans]|uniref:Amidase n=1 Tax=Patulibacter medicamentivorans TaxID=1097667 RepID=H0EAD5_9ACTN|nr:amidase family protein [Patulibacter medicamentivorans]EHN09351.1 Amidase [Patulibacter medicamentivorans]
MAGDPIPPADAPGASASGDGGDGPLIWWSAGRLRAAIAAGDLTAVEVVTAFLERIGEVDGRVNAIPTLVPERAIDEARAADRARGRRAGPPPLLDGLPIAVKDLMATAGIRTTQGSRIYADDVPTEDSLLVQRLRAAGAIVIGKTNTPEHGAGSQTYNDVFGATRNPYDLSRTVGGSSGGAAAAVAAGMLPLADGSDLGGSVRNPASYCNVVGLRPSAGRVASARPGNAWDPMSLLGPIARTVGDCGLLLAAISGRDDRSPIAIDEDPAAFADLPIADLRGVRIAWSRTVDGLPVDPQVTAVLEALRPVLVDLGAIVEDVEPDLSGADEAFEGFRALEFFGAHRHEIAAHPDLFKPDLVDEIERGRRLSAEQVVRAGELRTELYRRTARFLQRHDLLALPTVQLPPFPVEQRWPTAVAGVAMERYVTWMRSCTRISVTAHPALSLPAGFTPEGLPVGLQLVGRHRDERTLLAQAAAIEAATWFSRRRPPL